MMNEGDFPGIYIHFPFCRTKCPYCDFYSITSPDLTEAWLKAVAKEIPHYRDLFHRVDSVYLGGGTPSLLSRSDLEGLMGLIRRSFFLEDNSEITIEVNPGDSSLEKLKAMRDQGVNRISIGVQSFDEGELQFLQRRHTAVQARETLVAARTSGFQNIGVDLIFGFAGHEEKAWLRTLEQAAGYHPEHISCYQMTLTPGTPFGRMAEEGSLAALDEDRQAALFLLSSEFLRNHGYVHYEVSNFSLGPEHRSRHNLKYWRRVPYLGLGPSAHSHYMDRRWWNVKSVDEYCRKLERGDVPVEGDEVLSPSQSGLEALLLGFRTIEGVPLALVENLDSSGVVLSRLCDSGLVRIDRGQVVPTPRGFLVADSLPLLFNP